MMYQLHTDCYSMWRTAASRVSQRVDVRDVRHMLLDYDTDRRPFTCHIFSDLEGKGVCPARILEGHSAVKVRGSAEGLQGLWLWNNGNGQRRLLVYSD